MTRIRRLYYKDQEVVIDKLTSRLYERIGLRADSLKIIIVCTVCLQINRTWYSCTVVNTL